MREKAGEERPENTRSFAPRPVKRSDVDPRRVLIAGDELACPVLECDYTHESAQGIMAHVGSGHSEGWNEADATPRDVHIAATERDEYAMRRVMKVKDWIDREGLSPDSYAVYEHRGYGTIRVEPEAWLGDEFEEYLGLMQETEAATFYGDGYWLTDEFVDALEEVRAIVREQR